MSILKKRIILLSFTIFSSVLPMHTLMAAEFDESLLRKLCVRVWGEDKCPKISLAGAIGKAINKGTNDVWGGIYLINVSAGSMFEWPTANNGVAQPVVCSVTQELFYRRGNALYKQSIRVETESVRPSAEPSRVDSIEVKNLYACTKDEDGSPILWVETMDEVVRTLRTKQGSYEWRNPSVDSELAEFPLRKMAEELNLLHGIRADGYHIWVGSDELLGQKTPESPLSSVVDPQSPQNFRFFGSPVWIGNSDFLFTIAVVVRK